MERRAVMEVLTGGKISRNGHRKTHSSAYLNVFGERVVGEDAQRGEIANRVEFQDDLHRLATSRVVAPAHPSYSTF